MSNKDIVVTRIYQDDCTVGILNYGAMRVFTLELPNKENQTGISCIPEGEYKTRIINSPSLGKCIDVMNVEGRSYIRIHAGNYTRQIRGCLLVGESLKDIDKDGIIDVTNSKATLELLMASWETGTKLIVQ